MLGRGDFSYGLGLFDFSHEQVKWAVFVFIGFVFAIASAACSFVYLETMNT